MEWLVAILTFIGGGGLVALFTVKPQKNKVEAEAKQTLANAQTTEIQNVAEIAEKWRKYAEEAEMRYSTMNQLMQKQIDSLSKDVGKLTKQLNEILRIIKEMNHENLEQKKKEASDIAGS